jgi:hypothetical protein
MYKINKLTAACTGFFLLSMLAADLFIDKLSVTYRRQNNHGSFSEFINRTNHEEILLHLVHGTTENTVVYTFGHIKNL